VIGLKNEIIFLHKVKFGPTCSIHKDARKFAPVMLVVIASEKGSSPLLTPKQHEGEMKNILETAEIVKEYLVL